MARILHRLEEQNIRLANLTGGSLANAIPREASALIAIPEASLEACTQLVEQIRNDIVAELAEAELNLSITLADAEPATELMPASEHYRWMAAIDACPNGALRMSDSIEDVVETSLNIGVLTIDDGKIRVDILPRSLVGSCNDAINQAVVGLFKMLGAEVIISDSYPGWKPNANSSILDTMQKVYQKLFDQEPEVKVIHAGLECGLLGNTYPDWDMISFGPTIRFPHSPDEKVHIKSVARFWDYLVATLKEIPEA